MSREGVSRIWTTLRRRSGPRWIWVALLFVLGMGFVFAPGWAAPTFFTSKDSILRLPVLSNWRNLPIVFSQEFMGFSDGLYRPFSYAVIAVLRTIVPVGAIGFWHSMLIGLHALTGLMVFLVVRRCTDHAGAAIVAAAVFCFHPLAAVLTDDINHLPILLGVCLYVCSLLLYLLSRGEAPPDSPGRVRRLSCLALSLVVFAVGLLTSAVVITLPLVLVACELTVGPRQGRRGLKAVFGYPLPFLVVAGVALLVWSLLRPHPVLYTYSVVEGGGWPSFFSIVAGSGWYALGLLLGCRVPVVLHDVVTQVFTWRQGGVIGWALVHVAILAIAFWRMAKRDLLGVGIFLIYSAMIPFATTAWNPVKEYVSWVYLYAPLVGLAILVAVVADRALGTRRLRWPVVAALLLLVGSYGYGLFRINYAARSPVAYWRYVLALDEESETAHVELGRAYLARGEVDAAIDHLFSPHVRELKASTRAMCHYYLRQGDLPAAALHAELAGDRLAWSALFSASGTLDHAETALGHALARNRFDTGAMRLLAQTFADKGFVTDACRLLNRILEIDPSDAAARDALDRLEADETPAHVAKPPDAQWVHFLVAGASSRFLLEEVLRLSEKLPNDPVIQLRAGYCFLGTGAIDQARDVCAKLHSRHPASPRVAAIYSLCLTRSGDPRGGESVARKALERNPNNARVHYALGFALGEQGRFDEAIRSFSESLRISPHIAWTHHHMGLALASQGKLKDAVRHLARAVELEPGLIHAHLPLANAYAEQGELDKAERQCAAAAQIAPRSPQIRHNWAEVCLRKGDYAAAWEHIHECRSLGGKVHPGLLKALRAKMPEPK